MCQQIFPYVFLLMFMNSHEFGRLIKGYTAIVFFIESYHRMAWVEKDHNDWVSTPLLCAGLPTTRPGCPEPHPAWPWMPPGIGHPQTPWATCSSVSPPSVWKNFLISNLSLPCLSLKPFPLVVVLPEGCWVLPRRSKKHPECVTYPLGWSKRAALHHLVSGSALCCHED